MEHLGLLFLDICCHCGSSTNSHFTSNGRCSIAILVYWSQTPGVGLPSFCDCFKEQLLKKQDLSTKTLREPGNQMQPIFQPMSEKQVVKNCHRTWLRLSNLPVIIYLGISPVHRH